MPGDKIPYLLGQVRHWVPRGKEMVMAVNSGLQQEMREQATYCHQLFSFRWHSRRLGTSWVPLGETSGCAKSMSPHMGHYKLNCQRNPEKAACPILQLSHNGVKQGTRCRFYSGEWKLLNAITHTQSAGTNSELFSLCSWQFIPATAIRILLLTDTFYVF